MQASKLFLAKVVGLCLMLSPALGNPGAFATTTTTVANSPIVDLGYATYQGILVQDTVTNQTNTNFLGIRYAAPPTGTNRFRAAQPPAITPGIQVAGGQPNGCLQGPQGRAPSNPFIPQTPSSDFATRSLDADVNLGSEDCLFLNVYVPGILGAKKSLPVIFWIHGGGYVEGNATMFTGNDILRESGGGAILVVIQYRLGLFGFLAGQKVKDGGLLNAGLLDQQFALEWVQDHITQFGGDPTKVTIWGESAGAGSVIQHIVANNGQTTPSLFRAAMTSSTCLPSQYAYNDHIPELLYSEVVSQTNCIFVEDSLECLRAADVNTLQAINVQINGAGFFGDFVFVPVVDGTFITARPTLLLQQGKLNTRTLLSVTNTFEGTIFVNQRTADSVQIPDFIRQVFPTLSSDAIKKATALYSGLGTNIFQANAIMGESILICPTYVLMRAFGQNAFKGEFAVPPGLHLDDIGFYFPSASPGPTFNNPEFSREFSESFTNFAISLNPNVKFDLLNRTPLWKPWSGTTEMLFNKTAVNDTDVRLISTSIALLQRCMFWESVAAQVAQ